MKKLFCIISTLLLIIPILSACNTETYTILYKSTEGGTIEGQTSQQVSYGSNASSVTAVPDDGWEFVGWSDGVTTAKRTDKDVDENLTVTANFLKISFNVTYLAGEGGSVDGQTTQTVARGNDASKVTAVPSEGYEFIYWSDNVKTAERTDENIDRDLTVTACFMKRTLVVKYVADVGGTIQGDFNQYVSYGDGTTEVVAVPNDNYVFLGWDDGYDKPNRSDENIVQSKTYTAQFEQTGTIFNFVYNNATENADTERIIIDFDAIDDAVFPIPQRINSTFEGWYVGKDFATQITDKDGKLIDKTLVYSYDDENLYAKFSLIEDVSYKILMVYVPSVKATLTDLSGNSALVEYNMSDLEIRLCKLITEKFSQMLNEIFAGLVHFEVDSYFTTEAVNEDCFLWSERDGYDMRYAYKIPELGDYKLLDDYRAVITTVPVQMDDGSPRIYRTHADATAKYSCLYWEYVAGSYVRDDTIRTRLLNDKYKDYELCWNNILAMYADMLCRSVELQVPDGVLHSIIEAENMYHQGAHYAYEMLDVIKLFLLNQATDGDNVKFGIPYEVWDDKIKFDLTFVAGENGSISGELNQSVSIGNKAATVTAIPDFGYRFVKWSNGVTEPELTIRDVLRDDTVTAIFEEITRSVVYVMDNGGGNSFSAELHYKDFLSQGLYVPEIDGYEFEGWYLDQAFTMPIGDKNGKVTEADYAVFDGDGAIVLFGKFKKLD